MEPSDFKRRSATLVYNGTRIGRLRDDSSSLRMRMAPRLSSRASPRRCPHARGVHTLSVHCQFNSSAPLCEARVEWVSALPAKNRKAYLASLSDEDRGALLQGAFDREAGLPETIRQQAEVEWDGLGPEAREPYEQEAAAMRGKFSLPSPLGEACKAVQAIFMFGYRECDRVFDGVDEAYPAWIIKSLVETAPTTCGGPMTEVWSNGLCKDVKLAVAQPMLPLYLCYTEVIDIDVLADAVDAMLVDVADGYPKPANIFRDPQVDEYLKACLTVKILGDPGCKHRAQVLEWVDDYFSGRWITLFKDPESLESNNDWFQAAVGPNTMKMQWIRKGLTEVARLKGWA